jgi:hypothetical protein
MAQGIFSTGLIVIHTRDEFMLDFLSGLDMPKLVGRVVTTPAHAKRILRALMENFSRYEQTYGTLPPLLENSRQAWTGQGNLRPIAVFPSGPRRDVLEWSDRETCTGRVCHGLHH